MSNRERDIVLFAEGLTKQVSSPEGTLTILADVGFSVDRGESVAVVGTSGAGKSTLLALLAGLDLPTSGTVRLNGHDLNLLDEDGRARVRAQSVGFVFQSFHLVPSLTAVENVMLPLELDGVGSREARTHAREALEAMGLEHVDRFPDDFSGGQQQRIAIARATTGRRRLLLADEPTGSLDTANSDEVIELLAGLPARQGTAVVLVTHEPRFASWADRVVFLRDGRVVDQSAPVMAAATAVGR